MEFFRKAKEKKTDLLICHHGLSWREGIKYVSFYHYRRLKFLLENDIALLAYHLPLDAHPEIGNNAVICRMLGLEDLEPFGMYDGKPAGFTGSLLRAIDYERFKNRIKRCINRKIITMDFGGEKVKRVAVILGGGSSSIPEAAEKCADVFLFWEATLAGYIYSSDLEINSIFAWHYVTESFGVKKLCECISKSLVLNVNL